MNGFPLKVSELNNLPIKTVGGSTNALPPGQAKAAESLLRVQLVPKLGKRVRDKFTHLPTIVSTPFRRKWKTRSLERKLIPPTHPSDFSGSRRSPSTVLESMPA